MINKTVNYISTNDLGRKLIQMIMLMLMLITLDSIQTPGGISKNYFVTPSVDGDTYFQSNFFSHVSIELN